MIRRPIPYKDIGTVFLDAGNTLLSMDYSWIREVLEGLGIKTEIHELQRAEAAARPELSKELGRLKSTENIQTSIFYIGSILSRLPVTSVMAEKDRNELIYAIVEMLQEPGRKKHFWSNLMPGVNEAMIILKATGLRLMVVSNSNGIIEDVVTSLGIRGYFERVFDSHFVGYEKPDSRLFKHALEISGSDPGSTLHIGDLYHVDVLGAWSAGIHALLLDPFDDWKEADCERMPDLLSFARKIEIIRLFDD
jgi:HAD superfamily hydrolase (TIGR01549 family)